jgi:hypothetical protein
MNLTDAFLKSRRTLSQKLFEHVSSYDIYCHFIGYDLKVGDTILSPIRTDNRPTFILFIPDDKDDVFFKDFAWVGGNVFKFVKLYALYQESMHLRTRGDIIRYIDRSMGIGLFGSTTKKEIVRRHLDTSFYQSKRIIRFKSREFTDRDLWYWKQYHLTIAILLLYNVRSVRLLLNELDEIIYTISQRTLTFAYVIYNKVKLYRPEDKAEFKWRNTCPGHYIQGLEQLKKLKSGNRKLIITKSLKDVMVFHRFLGDKYDVIAPHSETYIFKDAFLTQLYKKYDEIIIIFDYDLAGVVGANRLRKRNPSKFKVAFVSTTRIRVNGTIKLMDKDISDYVVDREEEEIMKHLKSMGL